MNVGARIKQLRKAKKLSQRELADLTSISQPVINRLENNTRAADVDSLKRICSALGITLAEFFADQAPELPPDIRQMIDVARKLTPLQRELIISVMKEMAKDNQTEGE
ncbi:helix-turn-helix transcriptional regulator [Desulfofundulus sp. TPOSR]|jgi:transcriptional regulator with XRE-family HTH domain|uniref:helix-turn-helix domain-containing protein n=1 Tax=Desulfofundulus sp. TPOSR TaxID=2714340 RepID=UPI001409AC82|nr:helix-turn-helix transcriptional regulator [Desulfofundulus sp. TPOSR]NHM28888.1 helix-turn-helix transcriptional regulator [Desulfofundulus sp. TPOSR]